MARVYFGGGVYREPNAVARLRVGVQPTVNSNPTNRVAVIGPSEGGVPQTKYTFNSYGEAVDVLRGGDSLLAIKSIFNPSNAQAGAGQVMFIRGDTATSASKTFATNAFTVTTVDKGVHTNGFSLTITASSSDRILTVKVPGLTKDSGADGVTSTATSKYYFESATADFSGAQTGDVIVVRNAGATTVNHYTVKSVVSPTKVEINETVAGATGLTWIWTSHTTVTSPALSATGVTGAINQNLVDWINTNFAGVLTATVGAATAIADAVSATPLTGGTATAMTLTDIENALVLLQTEQVAHLYVARACGTGAGELSFAGALTGHLLNDAEYPAIAYIGAAADKAVDDAVTYAQALNSPRLVYCYQTFTDNGLNGLPVEMGGFMLAAKAAGIAAGLTVETPLTRKSVNILGLKAGTPISSVRERLLDNGVLHVMRDHTGAFVINQGLNTLQSNDVLWDAASNSSSEISLMRITDSVLSDLRTSALSLIGSDSSTLSRPVVAHFVNSYLSSQVGSRLQSFQGLTVTQVQDKWYVEFGIVPTYPINFVLITGTVVG